MNRKLFVILFAFLAFLASCDSAKQTTNDSTSIIGKTWKLVELNGRAMQLDGQFRKEPQLNLTTSDDKVNGSGGCNSFFGSYKLLGENGLTFSNIGATKMACPNDVMQVENGLFKAFEMTKKFMVKGDSLFLTNADMATLAKFVVSQ